MTMFPSRRRTATPARRWATLLVAGAFAGAAIATDPIVLQEGYDSLNNGEGKLWLADLAEYDAGGRLRGVYHGWDALTGADAYGDPVYAGQALVANECDYEVGTGSNRGLKTQSRFYLQSTTNAAQFALERTEGYGYDPQLDQLTSADYGDGLPNATPTWGYDAAGNRNDAACDALNRATSLGGTVCQNDVLGNRTVNGMRKTGLLYAWDPLSRLASFTDNGAPGSRSEYAYRADGMRVAKARGPAPAKEAPFAPNATTRYRHDGQMGIEDVETSASGTVVTRYGLGARGVDMIERTNSSGTVTAFPLYDAHGNNVASLTRSGTGYSVNDRRSYDAWGQVRAQQSAGDPKLRYCANLGHRQDDESGLVYMRARYYEPSSGRFISEDPGLSGNNWFVYAECDPVNKVDQSGKTASLRLFWDVVGGIALVGGMMGLKMFESGVVALLTTNAGKMILASGALMIAAWFALPYRSMGMDSGSDMTIFNIFYATPLAGIVCATLSSAMEGNCSLAREATSGCAAYCLVLATFMALDNLDHDIQDVRSGQ